MYLFLHRDRGRERRRSAPAAIAYRLLKLSIAQYIYICAKLPTRHTGSLVVVFERQRKREAIVE